MKKVIPLFFCFCFALYAKQDFYYSFIDSNSQQIAQENKEIIGDGFTVLDNIKKMAKDGKIDEAYERLKSFKNRNALELFRSDVILLESELLLKKELKRHILAGEELLENSINRSYINEDDLPKAYMILIELKLGLNKVDDAKYFIDTIINNFNTEIIRAYGNIYLAKLHVHRSEFKRAITILYEILIKTTNIDVATVVADELFDVYLLDNQLEEARKLAQQVIERNIDYYANDSYLAMVKVNKLIRNDMPTLAAQILEELLKRTKNSDAIEEFKFQLAQIYMVMYEGKMDILYKAKDLYSEVLNDYPKGENAKTAKMIIDEILMREGKIEPSVVYSKYPEFPSMQQKVLMQEILNHIKKEEYEFILKSERVYKKISDTIFKRYGYENLEAIFDEVRLLLIKQYLVNAKCQDLDEVLEKTTQTALSKVIEDSYLQYAYFECLLEYPKESGYTLTKEALFNSRDARTYLYLERLAYKLNKYEEALSFSAKLEMLKEKKYLEEEFLVRFQIVNGMQNQLAKLRYFKYAYENEQLILANENNPMIIDFYYQYYFYLLKDKTAKEALTTLKKLYLKQKEYQAYIYSPSVEIELAKQAKNNKEFEQAIVYLQEGIKNTRILKNNEAAEVYYELIKLYETTKNSVLYQETLEKCKALDASTTSLYKKMCDEM
ncbi:MAG: hypothetical protein WC141_02045 [Arcobacteraceae bacterium]